MNNAEAVNWLINITADIGKIEHQDLWHYEQALSEIREMLEDAPAIEPQRKKGMWIEHNPHKWGLGIVFECSECGEKIDCEPSNFCPNCGADMRTPVEIARNIVHEAIDHSAWSDTVNTAEMHKVVDDKYAEIRGDANVDAES